ncbi:hypothetical protein [Microbispora amethystogenes]|uniref:hypothetical protein n=1 Tax=Microbispora amethystogenes TaxID=1427754 RepID=UPI0019548AA1|nr:hypothetical protein [Microbispora amethystogenes]
MSEESEEVLPEVGLLEAVWRYRWSSLLIIILSGLAAAGATLVLLNGATATARFAVTDPRSTSFLRQGVSSDSSFIAYTAQRAAYTQSAKVLGRAKELLETRQSYQIDLETLRENVQASPGSSGGIIEVQAAAKTDRIAANIANAVVEAYQSLTAETAKADQAKLVKSIRATELQIRNSLKKAAPGSGVATSLTEALVQLQLKESDAQIDLATYNDGVRFVDQANPLRISPSKLPRNSAIGLALGIIIAVVIAFLRATNPITRVARATMGTGRRKRPRRILLAKAQPTRLTAKALTAAPSSSTSSGASSAASSSLSSGSGGPGSSSSMSSGPARNGSVVNGANGMNAANGVNGLNGLDEEEDSTAVYDRNALLAYNVDDEELRIVDISAEARNSKR